MVINGSTVGHSFANVRKLRIHLADTKHNEVSEVIEINGLVSDNLADAMVEMKTFSLGGRASKPLYHASISLSADEAATMTNEQWLHCVEELERRLDMVGHQRIVVKHIKKDANGIPREHIHIVWCRIHPLKLKCASDSHNYKKHEETARHLEKHLGFKEVVGVHTRPKNTPRPVAIATHQDWQASERTGVKIQTVAKLIQEAWDHSNNGFEFQELIEEQGLKLVKGNRGFLVCDYSGTPHSISRRLRKKGKEIRTKLSDLKASDVPSLEKFQQQLELRTGGIDMNMNFNSLTLPRDKYLKKIWDIQQEIKRLKAKGINAVINDKQIEYEHLGCKWVQTEDTITIYTFGEPTKEQISAMIAEAKSRGWEGIRVFGGSPEFQILARAFPVYSGS